MLWLSKGDFNSLLADYKAQQFTDSCTEHAFTEIKFEII